MDIERLDAAIRPRNRWEAMDLGVALARRWFLPLWLLWWLTAALPACLLLGLLHAHSDLWMLVLWWLKPLFEAPLLAWLARALFGERLSVRAALKRLPGAFPRRLWPYLLWRRLSLARAFTMPVTLLEGQRGAARRARLRVLLADNSGATWLTFICMHLEAVLWMSALGLFWMMLPTQLPGPDINTLLLGETPLLDWLGTLVVLLAMSMMAPFYVACGFALYLGRRTDLEAWDLELAFRRAASAPRLGVAAAPGAGPAALLPGLVLAVALVLGGLPARPAQAQDAAPPAAAASTVEVPIADLDPARAAALIDGVLAGPDFGEQRAIERWVYIGDDSDAADTETQDADLSWLPHLLRVLAGAVKWLALIAVAAAALLLARRLVTEWRLPVAPRRGAAARPPGPDIRTPSPVALLPSDLPAAVHGLLAAGDTRAALALLYRAQIVYLRGLGLAIPDSATEADCLAAAARAASGDEGTWLARLTALWRRVAYAHQAVAVGEVQALLGARPPSRAAAGR